MAVITDARGELIETVLGARGDRGASPHQHEQLGR
jgi:hypothetical protein